MTQSLDDLDRAILAAMAVEGVDATYRSVIRTYVEDRSDTWRRCCDSACDPCMLQIGRIVDAVRSRDD